MKALQELRQIALDHNRVMHPTLPEAARYVKPYTDKTANGLTRAIIDFLRLHGWQAERINCTGRMVDGRKVVTDVTGFSRQIGSVKWLPTSGQKGTADISCIVNGMTWKIEIKIGKDRQSEEQKQYQSQVEKAGGTYTIISSFEDFLNSYKSFINH